MVPPECTPPTAQGHDIQLAWTVLVSALPHTSYPLVPNIMAALYG